MIRMIAASALILGAPAAQAVAAPSDYSIVQTTDLDLSKPSDVDRLQHRMRRAVLAVCDNADNVFPEGAREIGICERDTWIKMNALVEAAVYKAHREVASR